MAARRFVVVLVCGFDGAAYRSAELSLFARGFLTTVFLAAAVGSGVTALAVLALVALVGGGAAFVGVFVRLDALVAGALVAIERDDKRMEAAWRVPKRDETRRVMNALTHT